MPLSDDFEFPESVDDMLHCPDKMFCFDPDCACHEDNLAIYQVSLFVLDGLMTPDEATAFVEGKGI
jgi:hypothetical protein